MKADIFDDRETVVGPPGSGSTVVVPPASTAPVSPAASAYDEAFVVGGFELVIGAPSPHAGGRFSDVTHRVQLRLRNATTTTQSFYSGNIRAVVNGQALEPDLCPDCPSNLAGLADYISGAEITGYLYYVGEPSELRVKADIFDDRETVVGPPGSG